MNPKKFDLHNLCNNKSKTEFRFYKNYIFHTKETLQTLEQLYCYNRVKGHGRETLCIFLKCFSDPSRYSDMIPFFAQPVTKIYMITNMTMFQRYDNFLNLLLDLINKSFHQNLFLVL